jgi:hypothetical protein
MTPQELKEKMRLRRETAEMVKEYWAEMMPKLGDIPEPQLQGWLSRFDLDTMVEGINAAMIIRSKQDAAGKKTVLQEAVNYASGAMNKLRPVDPEKAAHISAVRSEAGKKGGRKRLQNQQEAVQEFAAVCDDLPKICSALPKIASGLNNGPDTDSDSGFDFGFDSGSAVDCAHEVASLPPDAARRTVVHEQEQKKKPEAKVKTVEPTPPVVSAAPKTAPDGTLYPEGFDSWMNTERLDWLAQHSGSCQWCGKANGDHTRQCLKFHSMAPKKNSLVGVVREL